MYVGYQARILVVVGINYHTSSTICVSLSLLDKCIQFTALTWIRTFLSLAQRSMMVFTSNILVSILPCVAYDNDKSRIHSCIL